MKKSQVSFKIKNEKNYDYIRFIGGSISLKDLKKKINEKLQDKNTGPSKEKDKEKKDDILIYDEMSGQLIPDDSTLIAADKKVVIERVSTSLPQPTTTYRDRGGLMSVKADKSEFMCKLCKNQFVNPTLTKCCGDTACETCLDKFVKQRNECPFCKKKALSSIKAAPNTKIQEMIQKLSTTPASVQQPTGSIPSYPYGYQQPPSSSLNFNQPPYREVEKYLQGAKYFIIKSSNFENIELSIKHSEWATTKANEAKLNNAFQRSKNVILIFSVNKSSQFQGYARMESPSTNRVTSWQGQESIKLGGPFKVHWLRVCNVNFSRVSQLKNKFNNNEPIKKSRDTQEIPDDIGLQIANMFELPDKDNNYYPISDDRRRFMYPYGSAPPMGMGGNLFPTASSPRGMGMMEPGSDSGTQSDNKTPTPMRMNEDIQSFEDKEEEKQMEIEKKKDDMKFDLLADLDFDEPVTFNTTEEVIPSSTNNNNFKPVESHNHVEERKIEQQSSSHDYDQQLLQEMNEEFIDDLPLEHEVANIDEITEMTDAAVSNLDQQSGVDIPNGHHSVKSETRESPIEYKSYKSESEKIQEEPKETNFLEEEIESQSQHIEQQDERRSEREPPRKSPSREHEKVIMEERILEEEKKRPPKPPMELPKQPPPQVHYDPHMMARPPHEQQQMMRPSYGMDHTKPPPPPGGMGGMGGMSGMGGMRYPGGYQPYSNPAYPSAPYPGYQMNPYQPMEPRMPQQPMGMGMGMPGMPQGYPYYYGYPGMWGQQGRQFPYEGKGKMENEDADDNLSQGSAESDRSSKREKKKSKKEKKKKRSHERHERHEKLRNKSREKSEERDRNRSRDRNRDKSKSKSRRK